LKSKEKGDRSLWRRYHRTRAFTRRDVAYVLDLYKRFTTHIKYYILTTSFNVAKIALLQSEYEEKLNV
jgi:hypothetical protein